MTTLRQRLGCAVDDGLGSDGRTRHGVDALEALFLDDLGRNFGQRRVEQLLSMPRDLDVLDPAGLDGHLHEQHAGVGHAVALVDAVRDLRQVSVPRGCFSFEL